MHPSLLRKLTYSLRYTRLVSRVTVFDEIHENPYLRKGPYFPLFESKTNSNHSISLIIIPLSPNQSFETNSIQFGH